MNPAKKKSGTYVLTGRSANMTFRIPIEDGEDKVLTLERGVPTDVDDAEFVTQLEDNEDVYAEGSVPDDAIVGPPQVPPSPLDEPADEAPPPPDDTRDAQVSPAEAESPSPDAQA